MSTGVGIFFLVYFSTKFISWFDFVDQPAASASETDKFVMRADEYWRAASESARLNGFLRISLNGKVLLSRGYGMGATETTPYYIASLTKQFTGALIMSLVEEKKLKLTDYVCLHLEHYCHGRLKAITVDHLLTHTSGLSAFPFSLRGFASIYGQFVLDYDLQNYVDLQSMDHLSFETGEQFQYSNFGYDVLAAIAEKSTGLKFSDALETYLQKKANLTNTKVATTGTFKNFFGSGGVISTPQDLDLWAQALLANRSLAESIRKEYWTPNLKNYAKGWIVRDYPLSNSKIVWHNGKIPGYFSAMAIYPENGLVVIWLSNSNASSKNEKRVLKEFDRLLFGESYSVPAARKTFPSLHF